MDAWIWVVFAVLLIVALVSVALGVMRARRQGSVLAAEPKNGGRR